MLGIIFCDINTHLTTVWSCCGTQREFAILMSLVAGMGEEPWLQVKTAFAECHHFGSPDSLVGSIANCLAKVLLGDRITDGES